MNYYIYAYLDPRKPGKYQYNQYNFDYEPFYIGKGSTNRADIGLRYGTRKKSRIKEIETENKFPIVIRLLEEIENEKEAYDKEEEIIKTIGREITKNGPLVNVFCGYYFKGIRHDSEWKKILSKPVLQYDREMNFIKEYPSIKEAAKETGLYKQNIGASANSETHIRQTGGFIWKYKNPEDRLQGHLEKKFEMPRHSEATIQKMKKSKSKKHRNKIKNALIGLSKSEEHKLNISRSKREKSKSIIQFDLQNKKIKNWDSIMNIVEQLKFNRYGIHQCCVGKAKQAYGFIWKYQK